MVIRLNGVRIDLEKGSRVKVRGSRVEITTRAEITKRRKAAMRARLLRRRAARAAREAEAVAFAVPETMHRETDFW